MARAERSADIHTAAACPASLVAEESSFSPCGVFKAPGKYTARCKLQNILCECPGPGASRAEITNVSYHMDSAIEPSEDLSSSSNHPLLLPSPPRQPNPHPNLNLTSESACQVSAPAQWHLTVTIPCRPFPGALLVAIRQVGPPSPPSGLRANLQNLCPP